jgi:NCS2 family nucleobase:cation symporter-2
LCVVRDVRPKERGAPRSYLAAMKAPGRPVDEVLPLPRLATLGLQHVLVMYAGAVAVPLILAAALHLSRSDTAVLVDSDLFGCGLATVIQSLGIGPFGVRLPVVLGVTFVAVGPMLAMAADPALGITAIYGAILVAGIFGMLIAPFAGTLLPFFPPLVTGSIITVIGLSLLRVAADWAAGGTGAPAYGSAAHLGVAFAVVAIVLAILRVGHGFVRNVAVLIGLCAGYALTALLGWVDVRGLGAEAWLAPIAPFRFGRPRFEWTSALSMCLVMVVTMIESTGIFLAVAEITGEGLSVRALARGLRADGLGAFLGGVFNTFPYTTYSQNAGLVAITGVRSRFVCVTCGAILIALGLVPKLGYLVATIPPSVLGGAGFVMFGMVAASGIKILGSVDYAREPNAVFVVALSLAAGVVPVLAPNFFAAAPKALAPLLGDGIVLCAVVAVVLNRVFARAA